MNVILPVVSSDIRRFGYIEESVAILINYASEGDCLIDVGAHFGFLLLMADMVGKNG